MSAGVPITLLSVQYVREFVYMAYTDLQTFIQDLDTRGQLLRIKAQVDPILEISAIADRMSKLPAAAPRPRRTGPDTPAGAPQ